MRDAPHFSLIVPAYNSAGQLTSTLPAIRLFAATAPFACEFVFVDDGSTDGCTRALLDDFADETPGVTVLRNSANAGKGYSIARGMLTAGGKYRIFTDVDLAYPLSEALKILEALETPAPTRADVAIASRIHRESRCTVSPSSMHRVYARHLFGRGFNAVVRFALLPGILDSQAGLKGFTAAAAEAIFPRLTIHGFGFDVECLYLARRLGFCTRQVPVHMHGDAPLSTVRLARDAWLMARDVTRVRWNAWRNAYDLHVLAFPGRGRPNDLPEIAPDIAAEPAAGARIA